MQQTGRNPSSTTLIVRCCVCHAVRAGSTWSRPDTALAPGSPISHSYCPVCAAAARDHYARQRAEQQVSESVA